MACRRGTKDSYGVSSIPVSKRDVAMASMWQDSEIQTMESALEIMHSRAHCSSAFMPGGGRRNKKLAVVSLVCKSWLMMWKAKAWFRPSRCDMLSQCPGWVSLGNQAGGKVAADNISLHPEHASSERLGRDSDVAAKTGEPKPWPRLCASHVMRNVMQGPKLDQDGCGGPAVLVFIFFPTTR